MRYTRAGRSSPPARITRMASPAKKFCSACRTRMCTPIARTSREQSAFIWTGAASAQSWRVPADIDFRGFVVGGRFAGFLDQLPRGLRIFLAYQDHHAAQARKHL